MGNPRGRPHSRRDRSGRFAPEMTPAERELNEWVKWTERVSREGARLAARLERKVARYERQLAAARAKIAAENEDSYGYDWDGNTTSVTDPLGNCSGCNASQHQTSYSYDPVDRLASATDADGHIRSYTYDFASRLTKLCYQAACPNSTDPQVQYGYDARNRRTSVMDGNGHVTSYGYYDDGRLHTITDPLSDQWSLTYDADGNLSSATDANGNATPQPGDGTVTYSYDQLDRPTQASFSDGTGTVGYAYDGFGERLLLTDGQGATAYGYDNAGDLLNLTRGSDLYAYAYDGRGKAVLRTYPDGTTIASTLDLADRLTSVSSAGRTSTYTYNQDSWPTQQVLPSGLTESRSYDAAGRLTELKNQAGATTLADYLVTPDNVGNPTQIVNGSSTETLSYDAQNRLTRDCYQASCPNSTDPQVQFAYDNAGNRTSVTRSGVTTNDSYDSADHLTAVGSTSYGHDADGHVTSVGSDSYSWSLQDRLTSATVGGVTANYTYDGDGNRLSSVVGSTTTKYSWDQNYPLPQLALERDGSNTLLRRYTYGLERLSLSTPTADYYYAYDPQGSVANLTDSTGAVVWTYTYEPFGVKRSESGTGPVNPMQYQGEYLDPTLKLENLRARLYDPATGRFLSVDPLRDGASSAYAYAADNPMIYTDPSGMSFCGSLFGGLCPAVSALWSGTEAVGSFAWNTVTGIPGELIALPGDIGHCAAAVWRLDGRQAFPSCLKSAVGLGFFLPALRGIGSLTLDLAGPIAARLAERGTYELPAAQLSSLGNLLADEAGAIRLPGLVRGSAAESAGTELAGYSSFRAAKADFGSLGKGNVFDHVVEQSQIGRSGFAPEEIHNPFNLNPVSARANQIKANYYSSKQPFTGGLTVRDWLNGQSFRDQYEFGMDILAQIRAGTIK